MNFVQPIRDKNKIEEMKDELRKHGTRNFMLFYVGINSGLRISDLLKLNYDDVRNEDGTMKSHISIIEKKTNKSKMFPIANGLYTKLEKYTKNMKSSEYLFKSQKGVNRPISASQAYRIIVAAGTNVGLTGLGTHTLRKTFGYHHCYCIAFEFIKLYTSILFLLFSKSYTYFNLFAPCTFVFFHHNFHL